MTQIDHKEPRLVGESAHIRAIHREIDTAAHSDAKVLITGETGVGKDVVARLIHQGSARSAAPLATLNCPGVPDSLMESELFGHVRGSFTGAYRDKPAAGHAMRKRVAWRRFDRCSAADGGGRTAVAHASNFDTLAHPLCVGEPCWSD